MACIPPGSILIYGFAFLKFEFALSLESFSAGVRVLLEMVVVRFW